MVNTLEKLVDRCITDDFPPNRLLHEYQHAYRAGISVETTFIHLVTRKERVVSTGELAMEPVLFA